MNTISRRSNEDGVYSDNSDICWQFCNFFRLKYIIFRCWKYVHLDESILQIVLWSRHDKLSFRIPWKKMAMELERRARNSDFLGKIYLKLAPKIVLIYQKTSKKFGKKKLPKFTKIWIFAAKYSKLFFFWNFWKFIVFLFSKPKPKP